MEIKLAFGILSTVIAIACFLPYIRDILRGTTQPHMYSWLVWSLLQTVGVVAAFQAGAGYGSWALGVGTFFCIAIFLLSFKYGTKNISRLDALCLVGALAALGIYFVLDDALLAIITVAAVDFIGFIPTMRKAYEEPFTETPSTFGLSALSNVFSIIATQQYSVVSILYVASLFFTNLFCFAIIISRRRVLKSK